MYYDQIRELPPLDVYTGRDPNYGFETRMDLQRGGLVPKGIPESKYDYVSSKSNVLKVTDDRLGNLMQDYYDLRSLGDSSLNPHGDSVYIGDGGDGGGGGDSPAYGLNEITAFKDITASLDSTTKYRINQGKETIEPTEEMFNDSTFFNAPSVIKATVPQIAPTTGDYSKPVPYDSSIAELLRNPDKTITTNDNFIDISIPTVNRGGGGGEERVYDRFSEEAKHQLIEGDRGETFYNYNQVLMAPVPTMTNGELYEMSIRAKDDDTVMDAVTDLEDNRFDVLNGKRTCVSTATDGGGVSENKLEATQYKTDLYSFMGEDKFIMEDAIPINEQLILGATGQPPAWKATLIGGCSGRNTIIGTDGDTIYNDDTANIGRIFSAVSDSTLYEGGSNNYRASTKDTYDWQPSNAETRQAVDIPNHSINTLVYACNNSEGIRRAAALLASGHGSSFTDPEIADTAGTDRIGLVYEKALPAQCLPQTVLRAKLLDHCAKISAKDNESTEKNWNRGGYQDETLNFLIKGATPIIAKKIREDARLENETRKEGFFFKGQESAAEYLFSDSISKIVGTWVD